jgi:hypothetical protein
MDLEKSLKDRRGEIFILLLKEPGLTITEIAKKINLPQPPITRYAHELKNNHFLVMKLDDRGISKKCYPSYRGFFEEQAKSFGMDIPDEVYDSIDEVLLDPKIKPLWLKVSEKASEVKNAMSIIMASSVMILDPDFQIKIQDILKNDRKLQLAWNNGIIKYAEILRKKFQF